jgi:tetratricopeptide (TPR) repeat protein
MKYLSLSFFCLGLLLISCSSETETSTDEVKTYQAISALGDTLHEPTIDDSLQQVFETNLETARADYKEDTNDADAIIWYGRRTAYLGDYNKAIEIYSEGIEKHPEDARFYRHRGHRYITTRQFSKAVKDFTKAASLIEGTDDQVEPDGLPNEQNEPRSTLHTNIWYHLGLAQYLQGNFEEAVSSYQNCINASTNDDMTVAATYWLYMSMRRAGMDIPAGDVLEKIIGQMNIIENESYHKLLMVFKGDFEERSLLDDSKMPLNNATTGYGLGNWHYINGREGRAQDLFQKVYNAEGWNAFGYIAAETDLERLF